MKALLFLPLLLISSLSLQAQRYFYVRPMASMKANYSSFHWPFDIQQSNFSTNPYFTHYNYGLHLNNNELNLGISFGLRLDAKNALELTFSGDNASVKSSFIYQDIIAGNYIVNNYTTSSVGNSLHRITADYHRTLAQNKRFALRSTIGLGVFIPRNANGQEDTQPFELNTDFFTATGTISSTDYYFTPVILRAGAGFDIKNKKGRPFCSIDFSFIYNHRRTSLINQNYIINVIDNNQVATSYLSGLSSNGTGFSFQLSFPIKVYEFK